MFTDASAGNIDFGEGFSNDVNLTISEHTPPNTSPTTVPTGDGLLMMSLGLSLFATPIIIAVVILRHKMKESEVI